MLTAERVRVALLIGTCTLLSTLAGSAAAQGPPRAEQSAVELSLSEAVARALEGSEEVRLARAAVETADTQIVTARSRVLPQLSVSGGYTRTFQSPFQAGARETSGPIFDPDPTAPLEERVRYLEENAGLAAISTLLGSGSTLPFGREHAYSATVNVQQLLYSGGRARGGIDLARQLRSAVAATAEGQIADVELQVRSAYYRTLLADGLEAIANAALEQAQSFLDRERLRLKAGYSSELDVLRAEVSLETLRPQLVAAQNAAQLARLNLKRLVNIPLTQPIQLTTPLEVPPPEELANAALHPQVNARLQSTIRASELQVEAQRRSLGIARGALLPSVSFQMSYGGQTFPQGFASFGGAQWLPDWSATVGVQVPLFTGFETQASIGRAEVAVRQSELQLAQIREAVTLEYEQAAAEKARARASIGARQRTVDQAQRVYDLTVLRYNQGQATPLEVSQSRLELLQARSNLAQAIADFYLADAGVTSASAAGAAVGIGTMEQRQPSGDTGSTGTTGGSTGTGSSFMTGAVR